MRNPTYVSATKINNESYQPISRARTNVISHGKRLVKRSADISGAGDIRDVEFEREIVHGVSFSGRAYIHLGSEEIWDSSEYNDFYGFPDMFLTIQGEIDRVIKAYPPNCPGLSTTIEIKVEEKLYDAIDRIYRYGKGVTEIHVADIGYDWDVQGIEPLIDPKIDTIFTLGGDLDQSEYLLEIIRKTLPEDKANIAIQSITSFVEANTTKDAALAV